MDSQAYIIKITVDYNIHLCRRNIVSFFVTLLWSGSGTDTRQCDFRFDLFF